LLESILNKLTLKELGKHLSNYANLYIKPLESWRRAISLRTQSYDFVILHLVYYTIFLLIIVRDLYLAIPLSLLEIVLTLLPFLIFILPFKISGQLFKKKMKWNRLFRLFLLIKLQAFPIFILLYKIAIHAESEDLYIIVDNFILIIWLGFILICPLILKIKFIQKAIWILINYLSFLCLLVLIGIIFQKIDLLGNIRNKLMLITPSKEYANFNSNSFNSPLFLEDSLYLLIGKEETQNTIVFKERHFVSSHLAVQFYKTEKNEILSDLIKSDSILCSLDSNRVSKKDSLLTLYEDDVLTKNKLDSFIQSINIMVDADLKLTDSLKTKAKFKSNREFFNSLNFFLNDYYESYTNNQRIKKVLVNSNKKGLIKLDNGEYIAIYVLDKSAYSLSKDAYLKSKDKLDKRETKANFLMNIILFPLEKVFEIFTSD
jgi:hypothetical protein